MSVFGRNLAFILVLVFGLLTMFQPQSGWTASKRPVLLEFGAGHCISCKEMAKIIEELKLTIGEKVELRMVYADKEKPLFQQYKIMLIPTQVSLNAEGKDVARNVGALSKEQLLAKLNELKFIEN